MDREPVEREEYAHVPWADLVAEVRPDRRKLAMAAALIALAAAVGVVGARLLTPDPVPLEVVAPPAADAAFPPATDATTGTEAAAVSTTASFDDPPPDGPAPPALYTEADLMAAVPDAALDQVAATAEWFVRDYFTADGAGGTGPGALVPGLVMAPEPAPAVAYVEWSRATQTVFAEPETYRVTVLYRLLVERGDEGFIRLPVAAVEVPVAAGTDGPFVTDVPTPVAAPALSTRLPSEEVAAPADVIESALAMAAVQGAEPEVLTTGRDGSGWRVVVAVTHPAGMRIPLRFTVP